MKAKIIQTIIILAVIVAAFLAFYLKKPATQSVPTHVEMKETQEPAKATFVVPVDTAKPIHVGFLGGGKSNTSTNDYINSTVLNQLFEVLKVNQVQAVFFSGNLITRKEDDEKVPPMDEQSFNEGLNRFSELYTSILDGLPFFPTSGGQNTGIANTAEKFIDHFHLQGAKIIDGELLYTVSIGNAFFAVIATDELRKSHKDADGNVISSMLEWLKTNLEEGAKTHKYLFVVGYEPAFPSTTTFSKAQLPFRDAFWKILIDYKVLAYFSAKEHLFDRSNRSGVWQIISGGTASGINEAGKSFFHSLVMTIPEGKGDDKKAPTIQVIDNRGNTIEEFSLNPDDQPLYQMRISSL